MARFKYQGTMKDGNGRVVGSDTTSDGAAGTCSVYLAGTSTAADVYTASSGGTAVASVSTDADGMFEFWVDDGDYGSTQLFKITLSHADFESKSYDNIIIIPHSVDHIASDGSNHTFIDQSVVSGATPTFTGTNFTGIPMAGILSDDKTGSDADLVTGTKGDTNDFVMWNADGDAVGSGVAASELTYSYITGNDGSTDVTAAELEELSDGSYTSKHKHNWTYATDGQVATTSGTSVELTDEIPSSCDSFKVVLLGVSTNAANTPVIFQLSTSSAYATSGYIFCGYSNDGAQADTDGFYTALDADQDAATTLNGVATFTRATAAGHTWLCHVAFQNSSDKCFTGMGRVTLGSACQKVQVTTSGGTATFDAGTGQVIYI